MRAAGRQRAAPRALVFTAGASLRAPVQRDPLVLLVVAADIVHPDLFLLDFGHCRVPPLPLGQHLYRAPLCQLPARRQRSGQGACDARQYIALCSPLGARLARGTPTFAPSSVAMHEVPADTSLPLLLYPHNGKQEEAYNVSHAVLDLVLIPYYCDITAYNNPLS